MSVTMILVLLAMAVVMTCAWVFQRARSNGGWTDVFWTFGTGALCAAAALSPFGGGVGPLWRRALVALMLAVWSVRLGGYVAFRVGRSPEDVRYAELRRTWGARLHRNMFALLIAQAPLTAIIAVAVYLAAHAPPEGVRAADVAAVAVFLAAVLGEWRADRQMKAFKRSPGHETRVCEVGLWAYSRHPNYFFEALHWFAYPVMAVDLERPITLLSVGAPVMMVLIVRYGTGVPPLERAMVRSKGDAYRRYQQEVSVLAPLPRRRTV